MARNFTLPTSENLAVWNAVWKTDPNFTKKVSLGRSFTAIDPQYQILKMTEAFGPVGIKWGWTADYSSIRLYSTQAGREVDHAVADVTVWVAPGLDAPADAPHRGWGPVRAIESYYVDQKATKIDPDAPKKACTNALTKLLSHMGVSADVFLGAFDDETYVAQARASHGSPDEPRTPSAPASAGPRPNSHDQDDFM